MRIWDYRLLPYLPELQFKGQLRELVWIMRQWRDKGATNHLLINRVMEYPKEELYGYFLEYAIEYKNRFGIVLNCMEEFREFANRKFNNEPFKEWHNNEYLRVCMANLYEKHFFGLGKSRIRDDEWEILCIGYKEITGDEYSL